MSMDANREEILRRAAKIAAEKSGGSAPSTPAGGQPPRKRSTKVDYKPRTLERKLRPLMLYGAPGKFRSMIAGMLSGRWDVKTYDDSEKAINDCLDNPPDAVVLDMDEPTDWRKSTDIFAAVSCMAPDTRFILCAADPEGTPVATLAAKGAVVVGKPVSSSQLNGHLEPPAAAS